MCHRKLDGKSGNRRNGLSDGAVSRSLMVRLRTTCRAIGPAFGLSAAVGVMMPPITPVFAASALSVPARGRAAPRGREQDYLAIFNRVLGRGVTPANNAAIPILILNRPNSLRLYREKLDGKKWRRVRVVGGEARLCKAMGIRKSDLTGPIYGDSVQFFSMLRLGMKDGKTDSAGIVARVPYYISGRFMFQPWRYKPNPWIAIWLNKKAAAFRILTAASRRPRFFIPLIPLHPGGRYSRKMTGNIYSVLGYVQSMGEDLEARAMVSLGRGHIRRCMRDILTAQRLVSLMTQEHTALSLVASFSLHASAMDGQRVLAESGKASAAQLMAFMKRLDAVPKPVSMAVAVRTTERWMLRDYLDWAAAHRRTAVHQQDAIKAVAIPLLPKSYVSWTPAQTAKANKEYEQLCDQLAAIYGIRPRMRRMRTLHLELEKWLHSGDPVAKHFAVVQLMPAELNMLAFSDCDASDRRLTRICLALAAFRQQHGKFPGSLAELAPEYLAHIPHNPFTGAGFNYRLSGKGCRLSAKDVYPRDVSGSLRLPQMLPLVVHMHDH